MPEHSLHIKQAALYVKLGTSLEEKKAPQKILINIDLLFKQALAACESDKLKDTVCYHQLIDYLREKTKHASFNLIEHLGHYLYTLIQDYCQYKALIKIEICKFPRIVDLAQVSFCYGDNFTC